MPADGALRSVRIDGRSVGRALGQRRPFLLLVCRLAHARKATHAARDAAEGERRRQLSLLRLEEEEERRTRRWRQRLANEAMEADPVLANRLLYARNANWAVWIDERLDSPGTIFMAVGAGHMAGNQKLQDKLAERGIKMMRIQ